MIRGPAFPPHDAVPAEEADWAPPAAPLAMPVQRLEAQRGPILSALIWRLLGPGMRAGH